MTYRELVTDDAMELNRVQHALEGIGPEMAERETIAILTRAIKNLQLYASYLERKVRENNARHD